MSGGTRPVGLRARISNMKLSGKMILFFVAVVLLQCFVSLAVLTTIISSTNADSLTARMAFTLQGVEGYLGETFRDLKVKAELIAGQKKTVEYTDFGLKTLMARELVLFRESLGIDSLTIFTDPETIFASTRASSDAPFPGTELERSFKGESRLFLSRNGAGASLFVLSPIRRAEAIIGVLSLSIRMDQDLISRMEKTSGATVVFTFDDLSVHDESLPEKDVRGILSAYATGPVGGSRVAMASGHIVGAVDLALQGLEGGRIFCLLDTRESARLIARYNLISLVSTVVVLALALASGVAFYRRTFARRFQLVLQGIGKISEGDFQPPFRLGWGDELGQLAAAFDDMCLKLLNRENELSQLREKLALSSKLAALGEMAAGVAHQVRNPLVVMKVSAEMLRDNFSVNGDRERYQKLTSLVVDEADALNLVVSNFLDFARPRNTNRVPTSITNVLDFCVDSLPLDRFDGITVERVVQPGLPEFLLDRNLIGQAISNLILNALQASCSGGRVEVRAGEEDGHLRVEVQDWGEGMDEQTLQRMYNPFFTTRESGTGLGLSIVHRIVESHGGSIDVTSSPGQGTTFRVLL